MEPTQAKTGRLEDEAPPVAGTLGQIVRAGRGAENPIPVAAVVSIFDDLLAADADPPADRSPDLDDVLIDKAGVARLDIAADLAAVADLLVQTLGEDVPAGARSFVERLRSDAPEDRPADAPQLRGWMRDALGQPADRAEIIALVGSVAAPLPVPEPVASETPSGVADVVPATVDVVEQTVLDVAGAPGGPELDAFATTIDVNPDASPPEAEDQTVFQPSSGADVAASSASADPDDASVAAPFGLTAADVAAPPTDPDAGVEAEVAADPAVPASSARDEVSASSADEALPAGAAGQDPAGVDEPISPADPDPTSSPDDEEALHDLETIPPNGALMAPLLGLGPLPENEIPTDSIRKRSAPVTLKVRDPEPDAPVSRDPGHDPEFLAGDADAPTLTMPSPMKVSSLPEFVVPKRSAPPPIGKPVSGESRPAPSSLSTPADDAPTRAESANKPPPSQTDADKTLPVSSVPPRSSVSNRPLGAGRSASSRPVSSSGQPTLPSGKRGPESGRNRPVVRHTLRREKRISVPVAPATGRTTRQARRKNDSIMGPSDRGFPWGWLVVAGMTAAAAYYLLFT